jgi:acyl-CoA thioesterase FadM
MKNVPQSAEINYLAESRYDKEIKISTSVENGNGRLHNHSVIRTDDNKELCRVRLEWIKG